jgi:methionyl aminopeptidase
MRIAGRLAAQAMHAAAAIIEPGVITDDLDQVVHYFLIEHGAYPSTLGYRGISQVVLHLGQ